MKKIIYILLIAILFGSCSIFKKSSKHKDTTKQTTKTETTTTTKTNQTAKAETTTTDKTKTKETTKTKKTIPYNTCSFKCKTTFKGIGVNVNVRTTYDSIFWLSASSLGIEAVRAKCTKDSIYLIDKINKECKQWSYTTASMIIGLPLSFDFIQNMFTDTTLVQSYNTAKFKGTMVKKLIKVNKISLPEEIIINGQLNGKQQKYTLKLKDYKLNSSLGYPFDIPKGMKVKKY